MCANRIGARKLVALATLYRTPAERDKRGDRMTTALVGLVMILALFDLAFWVGYRLAQDEQLHGPLVRGRLVCPEADCGEDV